MWRMSGRVFFVLLSAIAYFALGSGSPARAAEKGFPYEQELLLDARPMNGSKRIPMMEVMRRGDTRIDLWCNSVQAQFVIVDDTITIIAGAKSTEPCIPERGRADDDLLSALVGITHWQRNGDALTLRGPKSLKFRASTH
jgi:heat shock protein HslJ